MSRIKKHPFKGILHRSRAQSFPKSRKVPNPAKSHRKKKVSKALPHKYFSAREADFGKRKSGPAGRDAKLEEKPAVRAIFLLWPEDNHNRIAKEEVARPKREVREGGDKGEEPHKAQNRQLVAQRCWDRRGGPDSWIQIR